LCRGHVVLGEVEAGHRRIRGERDGTGGSFQAGLNIRFGPELAPEQACLFGGNARDAKMAFMDLELSVLIPAEADAAMAVVKESFEACVAPDYAQEGRDLFAQVVTADYLRSLPHRQGFTLVAKLDGRIVGMCALRDGHHVTLFFVLPEFQGRGIGRRLFDRAVARVPEVVKIEVHSSPVAVPVYKALGFSVTGPEEVDGGIRYIPMERVLSPSPNTSMDNR
jgi:GNAT superfamily N-acetyltransferase